MTKAPESSPKECRGPSGGFRSLKDLLATLPQSKEKVLTTELTTIQAPGAIQFSNEDMETLRKTVARELSDPQFRLFGAVAKRTGLDPFANQIYAIIRGGKLTFQTGIDGLRLIAERSGEYDGQEGPEWCGEDGIWQEVWLDTKPPAAARVGVWRKGRSRPTWAVVTWREYCQRDRDGRPMGLWKTMPSNQLAKCAEAQALRKQFANDLSGIYAHEEMDQSDSYVVEGQTVPLADEVKRPVSKSAKAIAAPVEDPGPEPPEEEEQAPEPAPKAAPKAKPAAKAAPPAEEGTKLASVAEVQGQFTLIKEAGITGSDLRGWLEDQGVMAPDEKLASPVVNRWLEKTGKGIEDFALEVIGALGPEPDDDVEIVEGEPVPDDENPFD